MSNDQNKEWFAAFDPGKVNFAFIIEEVDKDILKNIVCPSKKDRFFCKDKDKDNDKKAKRKKREDTEPTEAYLTFLEKFYHCGRTILCSNTDITKQVSDWEQKSVEIPTEIPTEIIKKKRRSKEEIERDKIEKERLKKEKEEEKKRIKLEKEKKNWPPQ
jgi:hypothetical protein